MKKTKKDVPWTKVPKRMGDIVRQGAAIEKAVKGPFTLTQFKAKHGATKAAWLIGVTTKALWSWETGRTSPKGNDARRLNELGVTVA